MRVCRSCAEAPRSRLWNVALSLLFFGVCLFRCLCACIPLCRGSTYACILEQVRVGDEIIEVNGQSLSGKRPAEFRHLIRGPSVSVILYSWSLLNARHCIAAGNFLL